MLQAMLVGGFALQVGSLVVMGRIVAQTLRTNRQQAETQRLLAEREAAVRVRELAVAGQAQSA